MLAARLKNIFFMLLATQIVSVSVSFIFWGSILLAEAPADALLRQEVTE